MPIIAVAGGYCADGEQVDLIHLLNQEFIYQVVFKTFKHVIEPVFQSLHQKRIYMLLLGNCTPEKFCLGLEMFLQEGSRLKHRVFYYSISDYIPTGVCFWFEYALVCIYCYLSKALTASVDIAMYSDVAVYSYWLI